MVEHGRSLFPMAIKMLAARSNTSKCSVRSIRRNLQTVPVPVHLEKPDGMKWLPTASHQQGSHGPPRRETRWAAVSGGTNLATSFVAADTAAGSVWSSTAVIFDGNSGGVADCVVCSRPCGPPCHWRRTFEEKSARRSFFPCAFGSVFVKSSFAIR